MAAQIHIIWLGWIVNYITITVRNAIGTDAVWAKQFSLQCESEITSKLKTKSLASITLFSTLEPYSGCTLFDINYWCE